MNYARRNIEILQLPLIADGFVEHPERAILQFKKGETIDFGAFCYSSVTEVASAQRGLNRPRSERLVDASTFRPERVAPMRAAIIFFSREISHSAYSPLTVALAARTFVRFLFWANESGFSDVLTNRPTLRLGFRSFVSHLWEEVAAQRMTEKTAGVRVSTLREVLAQLYDIDDIHHGVRLPRSRKRAAQPTVPPSEEDQGKMLALCQALFDGLTSLCLDFKPYPYPLAVPRSLGAADDSMWIFPSRKWCMPPHQLAVRESLTLGYWAFDYGTGTIAEPAEIAHYYSQDYPSDRLNAAAIAVSHAHAAINDANVNERSAYRVAAALRAHQAFVVMFLSRTNMNWAQVRELPWGADYEVGAERQGFRAVKARAGGKVVTFEIQTVFLPELRKFLKLREYLLNGSEYEYLFMICDGQTGKFEPLQAKTQDHIAASLRRIDPNVPNIKSRKWRAGGGDWMLRRGVDTETASVILQNTESTVRNSYAEGSPIVQMEELGAFFDSIQTAVIAKGCEVQNGVARPVGLCSDFGAPTQSEQAAVVPDCLSNEGCFFCNKFRVHADEDDTRKLVSCRYVIQRTATTHDEEQFSSIFSPIFKRIEDLLAEIDRLSPGLVGAVTLEVENGELDAYWARKLEMLIILELVS
ncbi:hypothetical protein AYM40_35370 [Paraburkholderia phytofirmans OLGA172]|uniref:Integrase n=1 Tax=Paraburkholderia phytofirmans OLGA172 TaxID=1417228 RepID=A0A160FWK9_9BURK|nr:hypothetical protein [Paraburkholderia phytofirmans]ANB77358.1 hypothetical protein AYM40_35370 [Paraburkholderia phytofirmans OLGA172]